MRCDFTAWTLAYTLGPDDDGMNDGVTIRRLPMGSTMVFRATSEAVSVPRHIWPIRLAGHSGERRFPWLGGRGGGNDVATSTSSKGPVEINLPACRTSSPLASLRKLAAVPMHRVA